MSRRKLQWKRTVRQAGSVEKVIPRATKGLGVWHTGSEFGEVGWGSPGSRKGTNVTNPMSTRKEQLVRQWAK